MEMVISLTLILLECYIPFEWVSQWKSLSRVRLFSIPWTITHQTPLSIGFSRQEDWSGLPFPSPGDLPDPGTEPRSPALQADSTIWATRVQRRWPVKSRWRRGERKSGEEPDAWERERREGRICSGLSGSGYCFELKVFPRYSLGL